MASSASAIGGSRDIKPILDEIGMGNLYQTFAADKCTEVSICKSLTDQDLVRLGLTTIGDRVRFRDLLKTKDVGPTQLNVPERSLLFRPRGSIVNLTKRKKVRTWTGSFVCLSDKDAKTVPSSSQKTILQNAGLGFKKIAFPIDGDEELVHAKIVENFNQLKDVGGYELLRVMSNCRVLELVDTSRNVENLRSIFGSQCKIYVRPIQKNLNVTPLSENPVSTQRKEACLHCNQSFLINEIREHLNVCVHSQLDEPEDTDLVDTIYRDEPYHEDGHQNIELVENNDADVIDVSVSITGQRVNVEEISNFLNNNNIENPVDILRELQKRIVTGRKLEIDDETADIGDGETNFIIVDRDNLIETAFEELKPIPNLRHTLEVQFYGEAASDYGGPRKEFFRCILQDIQDKYFLPLREFADPADFETIGKIFALSTLQNGCLPRILKSDLVDELFKSDHPRPCIMSIRRGLDALGLYQIYKRVNQLIHLFTEETKKPLTLKMLTLLLKPVFSENGSNRKVEENRTYKKFVKYMKEVASGRRGIVTLNKILAFCTSTEDEPILGFRIPPSIHFVESEVSLLPTSNTCINRLMLVISKDADEKVLFNFFDHAFCNTYFGLQ